MKDVIWPSWPAATVPLASPGLLVADRYQLRSQVGVGAMGAVWLAQDQRLNRSVALKQVVLAAGLDHRQATEARQRILREGRIAARLQHPHAVSIYDVTMHDGEPWLVMEYVPSRSLANVLTDEGLLSDTQAARIGMQLADALNAAHQAGIVHRDVKPGNVLITDDGTAKLVDFGIARAAGDITVTQTGVLTGTPDYFAPEVARGAQPTPEADIFALGATLYICVEGQPPFGVSTNPMTHLLMIADGAVRPPRQAGRLAPVLERLLAADPTERPSASASGALLRAVAHAAPTDSAQPGPVPVPRPETGGTGEPEPRTTHIPPPRSAPDGWLPPGSALPPGRALPPTPRELAAAAIGSSTGRAAQRQRALERRRRLTAVGLVAAAGLLLVGISTGLSHRTDGNRTDGNRPATSGQLAAAAGGSSAAPARTASDGELAEAVRGYFALLPGEPADAWRRLTARAQSQLGGVGAYRDYWDDIASLRLISTSTSTAEQAVRAQLRLQTDDGQSRTATQRLTLVPGPDGSWLIDAVGG